MIIKTFEITKKKFDKQNFFLVYGENEGLKKEIIQNLKKNFNGNIIIMMKHKSWLIKNFFTKKY